MKHPTAEVRRYARRTFDELPLPWAVAGAAAKLFSRYAYDLITLHEMDNGDPAPTWLTIGHDDMAFSDEPLGAGVGVRAHHGQPGPVAGGVRCCISPGGGREKGNDEQQWCRGRG